jgi:formyltetrahydrofolate-dependent phosphoribosylglycinamide formyltransferase
MFARLRQKWKLSTQQFTIVFIVFGCTGLTAAYLTKAITRLLGMGPETHWAWKVSLRLGMLLVGYQFLLLFYGFIFGQWKFFWNYEKKLLTKLGILKTKSQSENSRSQNVNRKSENVNQTSKNQRSDIRLAIFASGTGTNAEKIIQHFEHHPSVKVALIVSNKPAAGVLTIAAKNNIDILIIEKENFFRGNGYVDELKAAAIDFIILAGFLWKVPETLINAFPNRIINIHPALLPNYGGKGMYGNFVHEAVINAKEKISGITIHYVDGHYDNGDIILQARCEVTETDTPETLAKKIHALEHEYYPKVIEEVLSNVQ